MKHRILVIVFATIATWSFTGCGDVSPRVPLPKTGGAETATKPKSAKHSPKAVGGDVGEAMRRASESGKYLFTFIYRDEDDSTAERRKVFETATKKLTERAEAILVNLNAATAKEFVQEYDLDRAPMPLALVFAPNGAVTGGFPEKFEEKDLLDAFASPSTEKCLKPLQEGKLVFLCVQNTTTKLNDEAMKGVNDFARDERFAESTEIVLLDPDDSKEAGFLADLKIKEGVATATTVFMAPPGTPIAKYEGATDKDTLVETIERATSGACGPGGCGPGGCGPANTSN